MSATDILEPLLESEVDKDVYEKAKTDYKHIVDVLRDMNERL